ncbi:MAG: F0F1 ATP synthase subunit B [Acidimicrobiales bacterium]|jgi:F-type H+-transporting ATPase subunit b
MLFATTAGGSSGNGGNFLIPNGTFVVELVIFLVVLGIIAKWILPPLQQVVETRQARIRAALQQAEEARAQAQAVLAERERVLAEARAEARGMIDHANQSADVALEQGRARGQEEYARLVEMSREEISGECRRAREDLLGRLDTLVAAAAERVLGGRVDASRHRRLIDEAVSAATASPVGGGAV